MDKIQKRMEVVAQLSTDAIFEYTVAEDRMQYFNQSEFFIPIQQGQPVIEHYTEQILNGTMAELLVHPEDREIFLEFCRQLRRGTEDIYVELRKRYADGRCNWILIEAKPVTEEDGTVSVIGKASNIESRRQREAFLKEQSERDPLTSLYHHMAVRRYISGQLKNGNDNQAKLLIADLDNFKQVNDSMGHLFGDAVLCTFSAQLKRHFPEGILGRIGGDEFLIYLKKAETEEVAERVASLQEHLSRIYSSEEKCTVSASFGMVSCGEEKNLEELIHKADMALYFLKKNGKGGWMEYRQEMESEASALSGENAKEYVPEAVIQTDADLAVFALELFENVKDVKGAMRMVADAITRFYGIQDILCVQRLNDEEGKILFHWGEWDKRQFYDNVVDITGEDWNALLSGKEAQGGIVLQEKDIVGSNSNHAKSMLSFFVREEFDEGYLLFVDRVTERSWDRERSTLEKLSGVIFKRLMEMKRQKKQEEHAEYMATHDSLTELPNYTYFLSYCSRLVKKHPEKKYVLVFSDFRNFHYINEKYGYAVGDEVLIKYAQMLEKGRGIFNARVMADWFITLYETDDMEKVKEEHYGRGAIFCNEMNALYEKCNLVYVIGVAGVGKDSFATSVDNANVARKLAKEDESLGALIYDHELRDKLEEEMELSAHMTEALKRGEFKLFLQPKLNVKTGKMTGAEALVRWIKADGTVIRPDQFIPLFEKNGFVTQIDFEMLRQVLTLQQRLLGCQQPVTVISVNFSRRHQETPDYVDRIGEMVRQYRVPNEYVEVEITESVFMGDLAPLSTSIHRLRQMGIQVSIDDFGSGYSSLNVLTHVEADVIKLDRNFLLEFQPRQKGSSQEFISLLIQMINHLGFQTLAEGVETKEQLELLRKAGCEYVQGYYYAKPMPVEKFVVFAKEHM